MRQPDGLYLDALGNVVIEEFKTAPQSILITGGYSAYERSIVAALSCMVEPFILDAPYGPAFDYNRALQRVKRMSEPKIITTHDTTKLNKAERKRERRRQRNKMLAHSINYDTGVQSFKNSMRRVKK